MDRRTIVLLLVATAALSQPAAAQKAGKITSDFFPAACPAGKTASVDGYGRRVCQVPAKPIGKPRKAKLDDRRIGPDKPIGGQSGPIRDQIGRK